jgi:hypothetical protein
MSGLMAWSTPDLDVPIKLCAEVSNRVAVVERQLQTLTVMRANLYQALSKERMSSGERQ